MFKRDTLGELQRLDFENFLWMVFIILGFLNIVGDLDDQDFIRTGDKRSQMEANKIFEFTVAVTVLIYIYFLLRNYSFYSNATGRDKELLFIKLFGSVLLLIGALCLLYFQKNETTFEGTPAT